MANIASGYIEIQFQGSNPKAAREISTLLNESSLFSYGGDSDVGHDDGGLEGGFSSRWTGSDAWDWIDEQLHPDTTGLSGEARDALIESKIFGYSYEWGTAHRDKVEKESGQTNLAVYSSSYGELGLPAALELVGAFELDPGGNLTEGNGVEVTLSSRHKASGKGEKEFEFQVVGDASCALKVCFNSAENQIGAVTNFSHEESEDADVDDFPGMNELLDDLLCERSELFELQRAAYRGGYKGKVWHPQGAEPVRLFQGRPATRKKAVRKKATRKKATRKKAMRKKATGKKAARKKATRKKR